MLFLSPVADNTLEMSSVLHPGRSQQPAAGAVGGAAVGGAIAALLILAVFAAAGITILIVVLVRRRNAHKSTILSSDQNEPQFENPLYGGMLHHVLCSRFNPMTGVDFPTAKAGTQDLEESCYLAVPGALYESTTECNIYDDCGDLVIVSFIYHHMYLRCERLNTRIECEKETET